MMYSGLLLQIQIQILYQNTLTKAQINQHKTHTYK